MWPNPDLVTFTEEILNGKLHFLCSVLTDLYKNSLVDFYFSFLALLPHVYL